MINAPKNPLPWSQLTETGPIYDATGALVAVVENRAYVADVAMIHQPLTEKLKEMTDAYELTASLLGVPEADIRALVAPVRALLRRAKVEPRKDAA